MRKKMDWDEITQVATKVTSRMAMQVSQAKFASATLISRFLGLVREQMLAYYFGAGQMLDAFLVAYRIPNLLRELLAEGAMTQAFVPEFMNTLHKGRAQAQELFKALALRLLLINGTLVAFIFLFAPQIVDLLAPTYKSQPSQFELCVFLTRMMSPYLFFISLAALGMTTLHSLKIFFYPTLAPAFLNVSFILCMIFLVPVLESWMWTPVYALAVAVLLGGSLQLLLQLPLLNKHFLDDWRAPRNKHVSTAEKRIYARVAPSFWALSTNQVSTIVVTMLASGFAGGVSWLNYAYRLYAFPCGLFVVSLSQAHVVFFSERWKERKVNPEAQKKAQQILQINLMSSLFLLLPIVAITLGLSEKIVALLYERGAFDYQDTLKTAQMLDYYILGLPFWGIYKLLTPTSYAIDRPYLPVVASTIGIVINIFICVAYIQVMGPAIVPIGWTTANIISVCIVGGALLKNNVLIFNMSMLKKAGAFLAASLMAYYFAKILEAPLLGDYQGMSGFLFLILVGSTVALAFALYVVLLSFLYGKNFVTHMRKPFEKE